MTWTADHPGGVIVCDHPGCSRRRRYHCSPSEREEWRVVDGAPTVDLCPDHRTKED